ncbi:MAG: GTA-gp10 family protein [Beijerinckiaceae bacterium]|nr:GTA-gp10 family protein [Beijerinckiaceae bacterium]
MTNLHRSEFALEIGGERLVLRLSLQALAEIEARLAPEGLEALGRRLAGGGLAMADLIVLAGALVRGGGQRVADTALAERLEAADLPRLVSAIAAVFATALPEGPAAPNPPWPQPPDAAGASFSLSASAGCGFPPMPSGR